MKIYGQLFQNENGWFRMFTCIEIWGISNIMPTKLFFIVSQLFFSRKFQLDSLWKCYGVNRVAKMGDNWLTAFQIEGRKRNGSMRLSFSEKPIMKYFFYRLSKKFWWFHYRSLPIYVFNYDTTLEQKHFRAFSIKFRNCKHFNWKLYRKTVCVNWNIFQIAWILWSVTSFRWNQMTSVLVLSDWDLKLLMIMDLRSPLMVIVWPVKNRNQTIT